MPFVVFLISAVYGIDKLLSRRPTVSKPALVVAIPFLIFELANHSSYWNVVTLEEAFRHMKSQLLKLFSATTIYIPTLLSELDNFIYITYFSNHNFIPIKKCINNI